MNDFDYFNACAIAALPALIVKVPLAMKSASPPTGTRLTWCGFVVSGWGQ